MVVQSHSGLSSMMVVLVVGACGSAATWCGCVCVVHDVNDSAIHSAAMSVHLLFIVHTISYFEVKN